MDLTNGVSLERKAPVFEWRACARDNDDPRPECSAPFKTRESAQRSLLCARDVDPPYDETWIERSRGATTYDRAPTRADGDR